MAANQRDPDGVARPAQRQRRTQDHAVAFGDDWVTFSAPQPKKIAVPPPQVSVPVPSGVHKTLENSWLSRVVGPVHPPHRPSKASFTVPREANADNMHHMGLAVPGGVPTPLEDRVDLLDSQFRTLGMGSVWCGKRPYRTASASHGGSCGTHDEWWTVCPPQTGSPRPPPPPVSVSPLSVTHNRRPSGRLSLDPLPRRRRVAI